MFRRFATFAIFTATTIFGLSSCGDSPSPLEEAAAALEGIYEVDDYTKNEDGCDTDGASQLADLSQTIFFLASYNFWGHTYVTTLSCDDIATCQTIAAQYKNGEITLRSGHAFSYSFHSSSEAGKLHGEERSTGFSSFSEDNMCTEPRVSYVDLNTVGEGEITIENNTHFGDDYPKDSDGYCTTDGGAAATEGKPCAEREVITAHRVSDL